MYLMAPAILAELDEMLSFKGDAYYNMCNILYISIKCSLHTHAHTRLFVCSKNHIQSAHLAIALTPEPIAL